MDPAQRERIRTQTDLMQEPILSRGILWLIVSVPTILIISIIGVWGEIGTVREPWPWRNAIESVAVVRQHDATSNGYRSYKHAIEYTFVGNRTSIFRTLTLDSPSETEVYIGEKAYQFAEGSKFKVYYLPERPFTPQVLIDPRLTLWEGVCRLGIVGGFAVLLALAVPLAMLAYRPRRRVMDDAKFELPPMKFERSSQPD